MSHYPSTAELASFRKAIAGNRFEWETAPSVDEAVHGIGWRGDAFIFDRHNASVMRHRAYDPALHPAYVNTWASERREGIPDSIGWNAYR